MKALGLSFSVFVFATLAAAPAEAHFRSGFSPFPRLGPILGRDHLADRRRDRRRGYGEGAGIYAPGGATDLGPNATPVGAAQFVPVPFPVAVPVGDARPSQPRLILIGAADHVRPHGTAPSVIYGDTPQ